jgi:probable rRNA maturation factor
MQKAAGTIKIQIVDTCGRFDFDAASMKRMLRALCKRFMIKRADISIAIVDDKYIKKVNEEFLKRSSVTDVISFDLSNDDGADRVFELVINAQESQRQARKLRHSPQAELALYVVHGFLHHVGFDDAKKSDAKRMHRMEDEILEEFGYGITFKTESTKARGKQKRG